MRKKKDDRWECFKDIEGAILDNPKPQRTRTDYSGYSKEDIEMPEAEIQAMAEELALRLGLGVIRLPDQVLGFLAQRAPAPIKHFVAKYLRGFPDLFLVDGDRCKAIEIKKVKRKGEKNGGLETSQIKWWRNYGREPFVTYGWSETEAEIKKFKKSE